MHIKKHSALTSYLTIRFVSALLFSVIVTVNLVYQATVVGLNPLQLVLVGTLLELVCFVFEIPTGVIADMYSRKLSVVIGVALIGAGFAIEGLFPTFTAVLVAQVIWGIGYTFVSGAREAWIADEVGEEQAGTAFTKGAQISLIGSLIGIVLSIVLGSSSIRLPIILGGVLYSLQAVYIMLFMPEKNFTAAPVEQRETFAKMKETVTAGIRIVRFNPVFMAIVVTGLIFGMFSEGVDRLWTPFMLENFEFPSLLNFSQVTWFGILAIVANIASIFAIRFTEKRTSTNNHASVVGALLWVNGLLIISTVLFGLSSSFVFAAVGYWLITMFREVRAPLYDSWMNQNVNSKVRATVFSMCNQANSAGQIAGGPILGLIATTISLSLSMVVAGLVLVPTLFMYAYTLRHHKRAA